MKKFIAALAVALVLCLCFAAVACAGGGVSEVGAWELEFFGDVIEEIRLFDPESQRSLQNLEDMSDTAVPRIDLGMAGP